MKSNRGPSLPARRLLSVVLTALALGTAATSGAAEPPTLLISQPSQSTYVFHTADLATATVPVAFQAFTTADYPLNGMDASFWGPGGIPAGGAVGLTITFDPIANPDLGVRSATGTGQIPVRRVGTYKVLFRASNGVGQPTEVIKTFTVAVDDAPQPSVTFSLPVNESHYTHFVGVSPAHVPVGFEAQTDPVAPLVSWSASLTTPSGVVQSPPISPSIPSGASTAGTVNLALTEPGHYSLSVTAANEYGTAVSARTFWVSRVRNPDNLAVFIGQNAFFEVVVSGQPADSYAYEWRRGDGSVLPTGDVFSGINSPRLDITGATLAMNGQTFLCRVTTTSGAFESAVATLTVNKLNQTISYTAPATVMGGAGFNLQAAVAPDASRPLTYEAIGGVAAVDSSGNVTTIAVVAPTVTLLKISQAGDDIYNAVSVTHQLTVLPVVLPHPGVSINSPAGDIPLPFGQTTVPVLLSFTSTPNEGFAISRVVAVLDATTYDSNVAGELSSSPALPSSTATTSTRTVNLAAGSHTLAVTSYIGSTASAPATITFNVVPQPGPKCGTALVRHAVVMNGRAGIEGSLQILLPENMALHGQAWILGDLLVPGNPTLQLDGHPTVGTEVPGAGPSTYSITLNGQALITQLVRNVIPVDLPTVLPPTPSTHDFTSNGKDEPVVLAPGNYRNVTINGKNTLVLPAGTYNIQKLTIDGDNDVEVEGAVVLNVRDSVKTNGKFGTKGQPGLVTLQISDGGLTLDGQASFHGFVVAPQGEIALNGQALLEGGLMADRLTINGQGLVDLCHGN